MVIPNSVQASMKLSMTMGLPVRKKEPRLVVIINRTGNRKLRRRLVRSDGEASRSVSSLLIIGTAPSLRTFPVR
jgi:hypothetical protein